ncbi:MAG: hypothetical protein IT326_00090 [Anaerolineae bacterium]|nr:hypothetical protein [Anaerolineae bacterium]
MFTQIFDLVAQPPGSLVYHFIVLFAAEAALAMSFGQWMRDRSPGTARLSIGVFIVFFARTAVLLVSLLTVQGVIPGNVLLPPVERTIDTVTLLALAWAFVTMDDPTLLRRNFVPDLIAGGMAGVALAGFIGTYYYWLSVMPLGEPFNGLWIDTAWSIAQIALAIAGLLVMMGRLRYIFDPVLKGLLLVVLAGAAGLQVFDGGFGDVAAAVRVGQLVAIPMLAAVTYRHVVEQLLHWDAFEPAGSPAAADPDRTVVSQPVPVDAMPVQVVAPVSAAAAAGPVSPVSPVGETVRAPSPDPRKIRADVRPALLEVIEVIGGMLHTLEEREIVREATRVVATILRADLCVLVVIDEASQQAGIIGGYDNIAQSFLPQAVLDLGKHPTILNALGRLRQVRLTPQRNSEELADFYEKLFISHEGPLYYQPMINGEERIGVIAVGSPYSERSLSDEERNILDRLGPLVTGILLNAEKYQDIREEYERSSGERETELVNLSDRLTATSAELNSARRQNEEMKVYIRDMHRQMQSGASQQENVRQQMQAMLAEVERLRQAAEEADTLRQQSETLRQRHDDLSRQLEVLKADQAETEQLRVDNQSLLQNAQERGLEVSRLQAELEQVKQQALASGAVLFAGTSPEGDLLRQQFEESQRSTRMEIASLRARLTEASISQQEVAFLQEQLGSKAREAIALQTRLNEALVVVDALREQVQGGGRGTLPEFATLQERISAQMAEIAELKRQLQETQAHVTLDDAARREAASVEQGDRDAVRRLEAQLADRASLIETLEAQLNEKARGIAELKAHMGEVDTALRNLERQLTFKTEEVTRLQASLAETRTQAQERIAALQAGLESGVHVSGEVDQAQVSALQAELDEKSTAVAVLEAQLANARHAMQSLEQQLTATSSAVDAAIIGAGRGDSHDEVSASLAQELRTPMSSIMGYTELLLRESVGILGSLQRKFLQRVKANTERMGTLLDDLIRITALDTGQIELRPETVDIEFVVEEAITNYANQFREKGLVLRMALAENMPPIVADREAVLQVLGHLLSNAGLASPIGGEVQLTVRTQRDELAHADGSTLLAECLYVSVEDSGGGIAPEMFDQVFDRRYRAENPLIEGLGDTGVGMALARSLMDVQHGRIWLESEAGHGSTFHVLLPLKPLNEDAT